MAPGVMRSKRSRMFGDELENLETKVDVRQTLHDALYTFSSLENSNITSAGPSNTAPAGDASTLSQSQNEFAAIQRQPTVSLDDIPKGFNNK